MSLLLSRGANVHKVDDVRIAFALLHRTHYVSHVVCCSVLVWQIAAVDSGSWRTYTSGAAAAQVSWMC